MLVEKKLIAPFVAIFLVLVAAFFVTSAALAEADGAPSEASDGIAVRGISFLPGGRLMISFDMGPNFVAGDYRALAGVYWDEELECMTLDEYPGRLYCIGPMLHEGMLAWIRLINTNTGAVVFETKHSIPTRPLSATAQPECKYPIDFTHGGEVIAAFYMPCECAKKHGPVSFGYVPAGPLTGCDWWWNEYNLWYNDLLSKYPPAPPTL